jgi:Protein of unknown function (DUF3105)
VSKSKQAVYALAVAGLAAAACAVLIAILANRDPGQVSHEGGPGRLMPDRGDAHTRAAASSPDDPPTSGPHKPEKLTRDRTELSDDQLLEALHEGNVVLTYATAKPPEALTRLQQDAFDPALADAGQAVILDHRPGSKGIIALAWRRELRSSDPEQLSAFVDAWLGQGPE